LCPKSGLSAERLERGPDRPPPPARSALLKPIVLELKPHQAAQMVERLPALQTLGL